MYLRTPKRYSRGQRRSPFSLRWLWLWILTPIVAYGGWQIYQQRDVIGPPVHEVLYNMADNAQNSLSTAAAPTAVPTQDPSDRLTRADADWRQGRIESALNEYEQALDAVPNDVTTHYRVTLGLIMEGKIDEAVEAAENTVTADPYSSDAWAIRAMALNWSGRQGEAIASAQRALELNPESARATAFLAEAYYDSGQGELALSTVDKALEMDPQSFEALRVRGLIQWDVVYDFEAARRDFEAAYDIAPNLPYLAINLAQINAYGFNNYEESIAILRDVIELNPQNSSALFELGSNYYSGLGNFTQASEYLSRCVESNPESLLCTYLLGRVQLSQELYSAGAETLKKVLDMGTTTPRHFLWAARGQIYLGNCPAAVPILQEGYVLALEEGNQDVIAAFESDLRDCQSPIADPETIPTEEATPLADA